MNELILSVFGSSLLTGLAVRFLAFAAKKTVKAIGDLVSEDEAKAILARAFLEFKESSVEGKGVKDEKILLEVFKEFFIDDRTEREFRLVFDAQSEKVDFNLLEEIFVGICIEKGIEIPAFNFFQAVSHVIKEVERLAQKEGKFQGTFQTAHLENIYSALQKRGMEPNLTFARFKYLNQLIKHNNRLLFVGIPDLRENTDIQLPAVFVMPRVKENVPVEDYFRLMVEKQDDDEFTGEEMQLRRMMMSKKEAEKAPVKFDKVFKESANRRFVVLGKPGSGKSTLLKYLMLEAARMHLEYHRDSDNLPFPILVEIRKLEHAFSKTKEPGYNILDFLYDSMRNHYNLTLTKGFFEKYLDSGRALLMFDGLDEVAVEGRRMEIRQMIASFVTGHHMNNTVIVTSRIAGYSRAQFSTTDYRHFTLEDFDDEEIVAFIHRWYRSRLTNEVEADAKAADLEKAFEKKPRIKELARNPLLLTIIGIIHRYESQLPEDRMLLYDKATEALLYTWDNVKEIIDEKFKPDDKRRFLEKVAFHLQSLEKGDEAGTLIERSEVYKILFPDFCRIFSCDNRQAKGLVDEFLDKIRSRAGLLVEQAPDQYGFVHKTFQEYFAARWIANEALLNFDLQILIDYVDQFIDNAFWHETLLLALRALPNKQAQKVLDHILTRQDPKEMEPYFYHHHYFAMKFIAEQGHWLGNSEFVEKQIYDFFRFSWNEGKSRSYYSNYTWKRFTDWVSSVSDSLADSLLSGKLLALVEDEKQDGDLRRSCAQAVGNSGMKEKAMVERLLHLAEDEKQDGDLRRSCAQVVEALGITDNAVVERLLHLAEDEKQDVYLRIACAQTVGKSGMKGKAVEILLYLAEDEKLHGYIRGFCAVALKKLSMNEKPVEIFLHLAEDAKLDGDLRRSWAQAAVNSSMKDKAVEILLHLASDEKQAGDLRRECAKVVGESGIKDKTVVEGLLKLAEDEKQAGSLRCDCVQAMGKLGLNDNAVVKRLLHLSEDKKQDGYLQRECAKALGELGMKDKAVKILLNLAEDEKQDSNLRRNCALVVGDLGLKDKAVVERLLHLAEDEKQAGYLRSSFAQAVGELGVKDKAVEILLHLAEDEKQGSFLRCECARKVGELGMKDRAVEILLHLAEDEKQMGYLWHSCAWGVGELGMKDKAVEILLHLAEDEKQDGDFRRLCAQDVGELGMKCKAVEVLLHLAEDEKQDGFLRCECARKVGELGMKDRAVEILLHLAEDEKQTGDLRRYCTWNVGALGIKDKAVDILINLYLAQTDKYKEEAQKIYKSLWELTAL